MITVSDMSWVAGWLDGRGGCSLGLVTPKIYLEASTFIGANERILRIIPSARWDSREHITEIGYRKQCREHCPEPHVHVGGEGIRKGQINIRFGTGLILLDNLLPMSAFAAFYFPRLLEHRDGSRRNHIQGWQQMEDAGWAVRQEFRTVSKSSLRKVNS